MIYSFYLNRVLFDKEISLVLSKIFKCNLDEIRIRNTYIFPDNSIPKSVEVYVEKISGDFSICLELSTDDESMDDEYIARILSKEFSCNCLFTDEESNGYTWYMIDEESNLRHVSINQDLNDEDETNFTIDYYIK